MGRACAVPKCKTGCKSFREKCSFFAVPKNTEQFKKWQAAIPGTILKQSQYVCEKHFEQKYVLREWVKYDSDGQIIAIVPHVRLSLVKSAVPTIFDNYTTLVLPISDKPMDSVFNGTNSLEDQCISEKCERFDEPQTDPLKVECADPLCAMPCAPQETIQSKIFPVTPVPSTVSVSANQEVDYASIVPKKNFILAKCTIEDSTKVSSDKNPIMIPTSWVFTEYEEERGQRVVFSNILRTNSNGTASTIINKSVEVEADKTLRYCVYGRFIDSERYKLPSVLTDMTLLPKTLVTFRGLNVCQGLGPVNIHHLLVDSVFQDSVQRWRSNDCTILAKRKRCEHCKKMRQRTLLIKSRTDKTEIVHRIGHLSNPIDRRKLIALRKKISQEKSANTYLKRRVQFLTKLLKEKAKDIVILR